LRHIYKDIPKTCGTWPTASLLRRATPFPRSKPTTVVSRQQLASAFGIRPPDGLLRPDSHPETAVRGKSVRILICLRYPRRRRSAP